MFYIPTDKALVVVEKQEAEKDCSDCDLAFDFYGCHNLGCRSFDRKDGKDVIFKFVDYKGE